MGTTRRDLIGAGLALALPLVARAQAELPQLRLGFQKSAVNLVIVKQQGVLEKRFPHTKVQWISSRRSTWHPPMRVLTNGVGLSGNNSFYLASRPFTEKHPQVLLALFEELTRADAYVQSNRKEAAQLIADFSGLSLATVHLFISRRPKSPVGPINAQIVADQQRVADAFHKLDLIPRPVKVAEIVWQPLKQAS